MAPSSTWRTTIALTALVSSPGCNDITLATISNPTAATPSIKYTRVTTSSMPNLVNANNPIQSDFLGDYMWVTVGNLGRANVVWADTRGLNAVQSKRIFTLLRCHNGTGR